jgi:methylated-DNA-[protein]-cysteine S-methyltransferase
LRGTAFQLEVWALLQKIPYGETTTYGALAAALAAKQGLPSMSAQAVGNAVGRNPVSLIVPCHRVVGTSGSLTGYGGGIDRKVKLLELEGADMTGFFVPATGTAL